VYTLLRIKNDPPMSRFLAKEMAASHYFDIARARRDLGYDPKISMNEGMRRFVAAGLR
jgi:2-alkyl-3-oxoalkanoate reductase